MNRPLCFAFMCQRIAEESNDAIPEPLEHVTFVARNACRAGVFVASDNALQNFGIDAVGEFSESNHVAEQNCKLATFALNKNWWPRIRWRKGGTDQLGVNLRNGLQKFFAMTERNTQLFKIAFCEQAQRFKVDVIFGEDLLVLRQAKLI